MSKDDRDTTTLVTLIEDPFGIRSNEIAEAQAISDELELDADLDIDSESLEEQLEKLARSITEQSEKDLGEEVIREDIEPVTPAAELGDEEPGTDEPTFQPATDLSPLELESSIEAILFISDKPLSLERFKAVLGPQLETSCFQEAVLAIQERYRSPHHGFELMEIAGGYQFRTKPERASLAQKLVKIQTQRLSSGCMETLAIIAYRQPVMKEDIDQIRGVDSSYFVRGLLERKLIEISGRSELPGRPILYSTTPQFLEVFGLKDLSAMPPLRELEQMIPGSQGGNGEDEDPRIRDMRRLVGQMKSDQSTALDYNPREDEKILKEIRERVSAIPTSTPYLDEVKAAEVLALQLAKQPGSDGSSEPQGN